MSDPPRPLELALAGIVAHCARINTRVRREGVEKELETRDVVGVRALFVSFLRALAPTIAEFR